MRLERLANFIGTRIDPALGAEVAIIAFRRHMRWVNDNPDRSLSEEGLGHIISAGSIQSKLRHEVNRGTLPASTLKRMDVSFK